MEKYKVVFEVLKKSNNESHYVLYILIAICILLYIIINIIKKKPINRYYGHIIGLIGFCFIFSYKYFENKAFTNSNIELVNKIIEKKDYIIIEGKIENFHPMPYEGHDMESFTLKGIYFEYSDFNNDYGFNNTSSHGGPIKHNGQEVRITYFNKDGVNHIIKIELKI